MVPELKKSSRKKDLDEVDGEDVAGEKGSDPYPALAS